MTTYKIVRHYAKGAKIVVRTGLSFGEAKAHCLDPETSSRTATRPEAIRRTERSGSWFDTYFDEGDGPIDGAPRAPKEP